MGAPLMPWQAVPDVLLKEKGNLTMQKATLSGQKWLIISLCAGLVLLTSCSKLKSRDQMNQGVQAYKNNHYPDAVRHFKEAVTLDPTNENAQLYLATSYMIQWVPGADNPDNKMDYDMARQEFDKVLAKNPTNALALAMLASMAYNSASAGTPEQKSRRACRGPEMESAAH